MAGSSDKARFYLEQSIPELQELQRKQIFSKQEVGSIARRRSDFEHKLNARGSRSSDYARYAEYEINLDSLRRKRVKRLGVKNINHSGPRRIFFIFDRATRKFHGDLELWMQYVAYARKHRAGKKLSEIITNVLRLHPTKPELWIYAASHTMEERRDIIEARALMQRGLRFCKESKHLWIEYARLEMTYVADIATRGQVLGLNRTRSTENVISSTNGKSDIVSTNPELVSPDDELNLQALEFLDRSIVERLEALPVVSGAIPTAIFNAAIKQFQGDMNIGEDFFNTVAEFHEVPCAANILQHITSSLLNTAALSPIALSCFIRQPVIGVEAGSSKFPGAFGTAVNRLNSAMHDLTVSRDSKEGSSSRSLLAEKIIPWMLSFVADDLDSNITKAIAVTLKKLWNQYQLDIEQADGCSSGVFADVVTAFQRKGFADLVKPSRGLALRLWPDDDQIRRLHANLISC